MELRQLEYFVAVAEEASFTRAAERVHISQSGVSAQVRQLERELGQSLLDRSGRSVRVTDVGAAVLPFARAALDAAGNARLAVDQLAGLVHGRVAVGMVNGCAIPVVSELLAQFHRRCPGVSISLNEDGSDRLLESVRNGQLDLALIGAAGPPTPGVQAALIADEALVAAVSPAHRLASRKTIPIELLRDQPLVSLPRGTGIRAALDAACAAAGFEPQIALEASALPMVAQLGGIGLGVAILPASAAHAHESVRHVLKIRPRVSSRLELVWDPTAATSPAALALLEHTRGFMRRLADGSRGAGERPPQGAVPKRPLPAESAAPASDSWSGETGDGARRGRSVSSIGTDTPERARHRGHRSSSR
jgi:DNA-binding transcriptional LysR family regulator